MRILTSYIFRSLCALLIGFLLVCNPTEMTTLIVQIIGGLFVLSGLFAIIGYFVSHRRLLQTRERLAALSEADGIYVPSIPAVYLLVGLGSMALGVVLILWPHLFIDILMYLLGALLVLTGIYQIVTMFTFRKVAPLSFSLFLLPAAIAAAGGFILFYPLESASLHTPGHFLHLLWCHRVLLRPAPATLPEAARHPAHRDSGCQRCRVRRSATGTCHLKSILHTNNSYKIKTS